MSKKRSRRARTASRTWLLGVIAVAVLVVVGVIVLNYSPAAPGVSAAPPPAAPLDGCGSQTCGQPNAPVTIDIYADFQCPYCARSEPALQQLAAQYVDTGKVKLVYHNFPVIGPESFTAAQAALCAEDQNAFWKYAHDLFSHQGPENTGVFSTSYLEQLAAGIGLNTSTFNSCLESGKYAGKVTQEQAQGRQRGVQATPTFFVNGKMYEGAQTYQQFVAAINAALGK